MQLLLSNGGRPMNGRSVIRPVMMSIYRITELTATMYRLNIHYRPIYAKARLCINLRTWFFSTIERFNSTRLSCSACALMRVRWLDRFFQLWQSLHTTPVRYICASQTLIPLAKLCMNECLTSAAMHEVTYVWSCLTAISLYSCCIYISQRVYERRQSNGLVYL